MAGWYSMAFCHAFIASQNISENNLSKSNKAFGLLRWKVDTKNTKILPLRKSYEDIKCSSCR